MKNVKQLFWFFQFLCKKKVEINLMEKERKKKRFANFNGKIFITIVGCFIETDESNVFWWYRFIEQ